MLRERTLFLFIISFLFYNIAYSSCGRCNTDIDMIKHQSVKADRVNSLVTVVPNDRYIQGLVITSCGKCNFSTKDNRCELSVKIGEQLFSVKGTSVHDHGDAHSSQGFCSAVRVARAKGKIKKNVFHADSFVLIGN